MEYGILLMYYKILVPIEIAELFTGTLLLLAKDSRGELPIFIFLASSSILIFSL